MYIWKIKDKRRENEAHRETLGLLTSTWARLEQLKQKLADQERQHQMELKSKDESLQKELTGEAEVRRQLEIKLHNNEKIWQQQGSQLQELVAERERCRYHQGQADVQAEMCCS